MAATGDMTVSFQVHGANVDELDAAAQATLTALAGTTADVVAYALSLGPELTTEQGEVVMWEGNVSASLRAKGAA